MAKRIASRLRAPLTQELIVAAAVDVLEEVGLEVFSARKLAERLGCEAMTLDIGLELPIAGFEKVLETTNSRKEGQ